MSVFVLENLSKSFKSEKKENVVLKNINLSFPDNGLVSIVGKSGSGKSTLLNILMGIEKPTKGRVYFNGKLLSRFSDRKFSKYHLNGVSLVFQHYNLFDDFTSLENAILPLLMQGISHKKAVEKARVYFTKFGIENLEDRIVKNLSGGEKQRVAIIRSLITDPKAILCDEPTGALDYKNSEEIMGILKELSKKILVIMVSHNKNLVNRFSDQILKLKDGEIVENITTIPNRFTSKYRIKKTKYKSSWIRKFFMKDLRKNFKKNIFSIISCSIAFASMFLCVGFSEGSKTSQEEALKNNLSIGTATISKSELIDLEGSPLAFEKTSRPELNDIDEQFSDFSSIRCEENISYLISNYPTCNFNDKNFTNFQMIPVYDLSLKNYGANLIASGRAATNEFNEVLVNEEFAKMLGKNPLNKVITIQNSSTITYQTFNEENPFIKDQLIIEENFKIVGILHEFPFLNTPKLYYSYKGGKQFLKGQRMENVSNYLNKNFSFFNYLETCNADDPVCSYSNYIFLENLDEVERFFERTKSLEGSGLEVTSSVLEVKETYGTFINSFSSTLIVFVIIAFAGINFILGMISLSTFIENRKNTAIMTCLGARNTSIYSLYLSENYFVIVLSFIFSIFLANFLQLKLNPIINKKFSLNNLIQIPFKTYFGYPFALVIILFGIALIFSTIFTLTPMLIYRHNSLSDELRDE